MRILFLLSCALLTLIACEKKDPRDLEVPMDNTLFQSARPLAEVIDPQLDEVSGMVVSRVNPGHLWVHNDSGDEAKLYLINKDAQIIMTVLLEGIEAVDWEDLSWREHDGKSQLIVGDIGDNNAHRNNISLHLVEEPRFQGQEMISIPNSDITTVNLQYKEGPRDAESLAYDYRNDNLILVTKREESVMVYEFKLGSESDLMISSTGTIDWKSFTSADINANGQVLLKNYNSVFYWPTGDKSAAGKINEQSPVRIPYVVEPQGEAIAWDSLGGFYTLSEHNTNKKQILYYYAPKD